MNKGIFGFPRNFIKALPFVDSVAPDDLLALFDVSRGVMRKVSRSGLGVIKQIVVCPHGTASTTSNTFGSDNTPPLITEGAELWSGTIVPLSLTSTILIFALGQAGIVASGTIGLALFHNGSGTNLGSSYKHSPSGGSPAHIGFPIIGSYAPASLSPQVFSIRGSTVDGSGGTLSWGNSDTPRFGAAASAMKILLVEVDVAS